MLTLLIRACLRHRWLVLGLALAIAAFGGWTYTQQRIDAYPDISAQVVTVITTYPGRAPEEVERQVTVPIELGMGSVPRLAIIRSRTIFGLSVVQLIFEEGVENYFARMRVEERLRAISLPAGVQPELGPLATAYGEIYRYELASDGTHNQMELRTLNDWVVAPRLRRTPGVAEVINFGGQAKQFTLRIEPFQLERFGLTFDDVIRAVETNNANAGGSVLRRGEMSFVIRGRGAFQTTDDIASTVINTSGGTPIHVRDVASVELDSMLPTGIFAKDDQEEGVEGIVMLRRGENPSRALELLKAEVAELNATYLPHGVRIAPFYDRTFLIDSTLHTVRHSIAMGITLVVLVLLITLGSPAVALLVVLTIPFSLLFALVLMYLTDIPIGLLSIGAIDFGILVDGSVIMVENIVHRLSLRRRHEDVAATLERAALQVQRPIFFAMLIIIAAYLPLLTLTSIEGLLFRPMAMTISFALLGAVVFALVVIPPLALLMFRRGFTDWDNPLMHRARDAYGAIIARLLKARWAVVVFLVVVIATVCVTVVPRLGTEFLPYLDEGVIWVRANYPEGTSLQQTAEFGKRLRAIALEFADVDFVVAQAGRNDSGTDPFPPSRLEMMIGPKPREEWVSRSKQELVAHIAARFREEFPTTRFNFTQPIIDSVTEDTNGTSANLAVEFSGPDLDVLLPLARKTRDVLRQVPGAQDVNVEQEGPQPQLLIEPDRALCASYDVQIDDVNQLINTALGGQPIGRLYEGERSFDIVARFDRDLITSREAIERLPVYANSGVPIPLSQVAHFRLVDGQTIIARDSGRRRLTVRCDIGGRDQGGFVTDAQAAFAREMKVPEGVRVRWLGMFENLARARRHFALLFPVTVGLVFLLLWSTFGRLRETFVVLLAVPFAFVGGLLALYVRGMHLNVSSAVGFATLFGVAIMDGVVLVQCISGLRREGLPLDQAIVHGARRRFRPILTTAPVAILGLLPASVAIGLGSDVQRPLATVIVWGLASSTILTLFIVPVIYRIAAPPDDAASAADGTSSAGAAG
ncbi:MAG: CusA/CzcA family heavy metal efflux RND transporter [Pirellulales bacterium]|nr:CusA/CzcA family heavy metal efflux RND transporter [Pirellulales bacterium]